jgi:hypothetical protein
LHLAPQQAAFGVDFFLPNLRAEQRLLAVDGERAGQRHTEAYFDRCGALREHARSAECGRNKRGAQSRIDIAT